MAFEKIGCMPELCRAVEEMDWMLPTDIQDEAIPLILGGGDVLLAAETGSGKTGAFSLPIVQIVAESLQEGPVPAAKQRATSRQLRMSALDRDDNFAVDAAGLLCQAREAHKWQGGRATAGALKGKHYYEVTVTDEGLCRVGWATQSATLETGIDDQSFGFGGTGKKSTARQFEDYGEPFGLNDVIGCLLDLDNQTMAFSKNGKDLGKAYDLPASIRGQALFPACTVKNAELRFCFSGANMKHLPQGYTPMGDQPTTHLASPGAKSNGKGPLALILEPSRELAEQTRDQLNLFKKHISDCNLRTALLIGGMSAKDQLKQLAQGVEIIVGTPGRVEDFVKTGKLDLGRVRFFVMDEVDALLSQGHFNLLRDLYKRMPQEDPAGRRLQVVVCSATLHSPDVTKLAETIMYHPAWVDLKGMDSVPDTVHHAVVRIDPTRDTWWHQVPAYARTDDVHARDNIKPQRQSKEDLSEGVKRLKYKYLLAAIDQHQMDQAIIFCRTKLDCDNVERFLQTEGGGAKAMVNGYTCVCVHSDRRVPERRENLQKFKDGEARFLICTDVAARGIDVKGIPYVINFTMPDEKQNYVHRIGRVGRADRMGLAISFVATVPEKVWYHKCPARGKGCHNTRLVEQGGCTIWYDEPNLLSEVQAHIGVVIPELDESMAVPHHEYDGKVVYGEARDKNKQQYAGHAALLAPSVAELTSLEHSAQTSYLQLLTSL